jgi:hypothetical protein
MMDARERQMIDTLWDAYQRSNGFRVRTTPPLLEYDGRHVYLPPSWLATGFFPAELTGSSAASSSPGSGEIDGDGWKYSWKERKQSAAGVWKDGDRSGTGNAYLAEPSAGASATAIANGTLALMRPSPTVEGLWEFVPISGATLTVRTVGGSPSYPGIAIEEYTDFFTVSNPATATARVDLNEEKFHELTLLKCVAPIFVWRKYEIVDGAIVRTEYDVETIGADKVQVDMSIKDVTITPLLSEDPVEGECTLAPVACCFDWYCTVGGVVSVPKDGPAPASAIAGPFPTEAEATTACGTSSTVSVTCGECAADFPRFGRFEFRNRTGVCTALPDKVPVTWAAGGVATGNWSGAAEVVNPVNDQTYAVGWEIVFDCPNNKIYFGWGAGTAEAVCGNIPRVYSVSPQAPWVCEGAPGLDTIAKPYSCPDFPFDRIGCDIEEWIATYDFTCTEGPVGSFDVYFVGYVCP